MVVLHNQGQLRPSYDEHYLSQPSANLRLADGQLAVVTIELTENENLNVQKSPCESDPNYDLGLCLESYLSKNASCKLPWSPRRSLIPERDCATADDFSRLMFIQDQYRDWTSHKTYERTKCLKPCKYQSFKAEVSYQTLPPFNLPSQVGVFISYKQSAIIKKKQYLIYNVNSLIAEIGGSMGVFIGASFITIYDLALDGIGILSKLFRCSEKAK
ncbi:hypothetical protein TCAL_11887 [Tigriopus californicus]|uniref:Uncharacterized protein n=1 Tax=Tigriopus californicus TaxID=6832 RepID=A0A553NZJ0_TIGCA|nr:acid-sensing ion channel 1C-like [Tigriopus californicus]TRY70856.1 hypothetical protein TCAL_11887 [Tigriopus californicus]|eukprot:TCALIF_11887-PA protein Name:"Protein of unknown function" AED:0.19 eAED:0.19 QI:0/1/0/1/1/0.5/2/0/214